MDEIKPVEIKLKRKYLVGGKSRYHARYSGNNNPARHGHPLTEKEKALHARQPNKVMVIRANGPARMIIVPK